MIRNPRKNDGCRGTGRRCAPDVRTQRAVKKVIRLEEFIAKGRWGGKNTGLVEEEK